MKYLHDLHSARPDADFHSAGREPTGEPGSGKTTLCRRLCDSLHTGLYRVIYVPLTTGNVMDMYKSIAWGSGLPTERNRASAFRTIQGEVNRVLLEGKQRPVIIVDE